MAEISREADSLTPLLGRVGLAGRNPALIATLALAMGIGDDARLLLNRAGAQEVPPPPASGEDIAHIDTRTNPEGSPSERVYGEIIVSEKNTTIIFDLSAVRSADGSKCVASGTVTYVVDGVRRLPIQVQNLEAPVVDGEFSHDDLIRLADIQAAATNTLSPPPEVTKKSPGSYQVTWEDERTGKKFDVHVLYFGVESPDGKQSFIVQISGTVDLDGVVTQVKGVDEPADVLLTPSAVIRLVDDAATRLQSR